MKKLLDGLSSGPLLLFDMHGNVIIISSFNNFMAASFSHDDKSGVIGWGIMGDVDRVPQGYNLETIMFYGSEGINKVWKN